MLRMKALDYSAITDNLYVGKTPHGKDYQMLKGQGVALVINMRLEWPITQLRMHDNLEEVWVPSIDSRYLPLRKKKILQVAGKALEVLKSGGKVYVFCRHGHHRSVVMAATILLLQGHKPEAVLGLFKKTRSIDHRALEIASNLVNG